LFGLPRASQSSRVLARALNAVLLALLGYALVGAWLARRHATAATSLLFACVAVYTGLAVAFHVLIPTAHHADFRFAYPLLVPASALFADIVGGLRRRRL
jgi:hypothetical protein